MESLITTTIVQVGKEEPKILSILKDGQATRCGTFLDVCKQFVSKGQKIGRVDGKIIPDQVQIGPCKLTGVACLSMARVIANKII